MAEVRFIKVSSLPVTGEKYATYFLAEADSYSMHQADEAGALKPVYYDFLPDRDTNDGKVLGLVSGNLVWVDGAGTGLPDMANNAGKILSTDGTNAFWIPVAGNNKTAIIDGGEVTWTGIGFVFDVNETNYLFDGSPKHTDDDQKTLDAAHPTLPRLDVIAVDINENVVVLTGVPEANPVKPQVDPLTQIELTTILVPAGATTPIDISNVMVYNENVEYITSAIWSTSVNFDNTVGPLSGLKALQAGGFVNGNRMRFEVPGGGSINITEYSGFVFFVELLNTFANSNGFQVSFWQNATTMASNYVNVTNNNYGFSRTTINTYQGINIPISAFNFVSSSVKIIEIRMIGNSSSNFRMDLIQLQKGIIQTGQSAVPNLAQVTAKGNVTPDPIFADFFALNTGFAYLFTEDNAGAIEIAESTGAASFGAYGTENGKLVFYKNSLSKSLVLKWENLSDDRVIQMPDSSGVILLSVNSVSPNNAGNVNISLNSVTGIGRFSNNIIQMGVGYELRNTGNTATLGEWFNVGNQNSELYLYNLSDSRYIMLKYSEIDFALSGGKHQYIKPYPTPTDFSREFTLPNITANRYLAVSVNNQFADAAGNITLNIDLSAYIPLTQKGAASGVVPLNASTKIDEIYLPDSILGQVEYQDVWNATTNTPAIPAASSANKGHYYIVNVAGSTSIDGESDWKVGDWIISNGTTWSKVDNTDAISSFNGRTGAITLLLADVTSALGYTPVPETRTIEINGTSYDLSANRSWTISGLPSQSTHAGKTLFTDGTTAFWQLATATLLTGFNGSASPAALSSTDTILQALEKLNANTVQLVTTVNRININSFQSIM